MDASLIDSPLFQRLDRSTVLQDARIFHESPIIPRRCALILTRILYLIHQGEVFNAKEATDLFFAVTKLFQSPDVCLFVMLSIESRRKLKRGWYARYRSGCGG